MKSFKKVIAIVFALVLAMSMGVSAFAEGETGTITINAPANNAITLEGKTYTAYKVLSATTDGNDHYAYYVTDEFINLPAFVGKTNPDIQVYISGLTASELADFAKTVTDYAVAKSIAGVSATGTAESPKTLTIENLPYGYYVVGEEGSDDVHAACALNTVTDDVVITLKADVPSLEKSIVEDNTLVKGTDAALGDVINFQLDSKVPDMTAYDSYTYTVGDTMSDGLTYDADSITVTIGENTYSYNDIIAAESHFAYDTAPATGTFELTIDLLAMNAARGDDITINYSATLNQNAVIGGEGNPNTAKLTYSNNPYDDTTDSTPDSTVYVYTFKLDGTKVDGADVTTKLAGAIFSLYTTTPDGGAVDSTIGGVDVYLVKDNITSDANGIFTATELRAGTYYLVETTAPVGYNLLLDPIVFTITATYDANDGTIDTFTTDNTATFVPTITTGSVALTVANNAGSILPSTGGIGTTIFTVVGLSLMIGAAVILLLKKKASAK